MEIVIGWVILSIVVGAPGSERKIGFAGALFLSPLIGLIVTVFSKDMEDEEYKENILRAQQNQQKALNKLSEEKIISSKNTSILDELVKLKELKDDNTITEEEFQSLKSKIINSPDLVINLNKTSTFNKPDLDYTQSNNSINNFAILLQDVQIPLKIKEELNLDTSTLKYQIKEIERYMKYYYLNEYPFYAALELDSRNQKLSEELIENLITVANNYFDSESINEVLHKLKKTGNKSYNK